MNVISRNIIEHDPSLFIHLTKTSGDQAVLIGALEEFCVKTPYTISLFISIVQAFHRDRILDSNALKQWVSSSTESSWLIDKQIAIGLRKQMKEYIKSI